ncbi:putative membrane protein [Candidatus Protofrankia californiensis]|uniref:Putative membrane protein n=1 Tax=Candidatus Protofrankia californiensis TaxID=1839754 RepID=A0A1C3NTI5_9ACTN|nr:putative membrane protein [Candidatus Protofrankia californiensis]
MAYFLAFLMLAVIGAAVWFVLRTKPIGDDTVQRMNARASELERRDAASGDR